MSWSNESERHRLARMGVKSMGRLRTSHVHPSPFIYDNCGKESSRHGLHLEFSGNFEKETMRTKAFCSDCWFDKYGDRFVSYVDIGE